MLQIEKKELRDRFVRERNDIPAALRREYSDDIFERIRSLVRYKISRLILVFVSAGSEPETHRFIETALSDGKKVAVPFIADGEMSFRFIESFSELVPELSVFPSLRLTMKQRRIFPPVCALRPVSPLMKTECGSVTAEVSMTDSFRSTAEFMRPRCVLTN